MCEESSEVFFSLHASIPIVVHKLLLKRNQSFVGDVLGIQGVLACNAISKLIFEAYLEELLPGTHFFRQMTDFTCESIFHHIQSGDNTFTFSFT